MTSPVKQVILVARAAPNNSSLGIKSRSKQTSNRTNIEKIAKGIRGFPHPCIIVDNASVIDKKEMPKTIMLNG